MLVQLALCLPKCPTLSSRILLVPFQTVESFLRLTLASQSTNVMFTQIGTRKVTGKVSPQLYRPMYDS
jgi:hypothetical protein